MTIELRIFATTTLRPYIDFDHCSVPTMSLHRAAHRLVFHGGKYATRTPPAAPMSSMSYATSAAAAQEPSEEPPQQVDQSEHPSGDGKPQATATLFRRPTARRARPGRVASAAARKTSSFNDAVTRASDGARKTGLSAEAVKAGMGRQDDVGSEHGARPMARVPFEPPKEAGM